MPLQIKSLASGSSGNCYLLTDGKNRLLIEGGLPFKEIQEGLGYKLSTVDCCLLSHEHGDHSKSVKRIMSAGIDVYTSYGTIEALGLSGHRINPLSYEGTIYHLPGRWRVMPFQTEHDAAEPLGFLIMSPSGEIILYATDTYYVKPTFKKLTHIMIEVNYSADIINENVDSGALSSGLKKRVVSSHFSLENVIEALKANDLSAVKEIWLLHLSDTNSDEKLFKTEVQKATGKIVRIA